MCTLINSKKNEYLKSEKPLTVYKYIQYDKRTDCYKTPYQDCNISDACVSGDEPFVAKGKIVYHPAYKDFAWWYDVYKYRIEGGLIHCYVNLEDAIADVKHWGGDFTFLDFHVFEVEVPANVEYVEGILGYSDRVDNPMNGKKVVAAKEIRFIKEIPLRKNNI